MADFVYRTTVEYSAPAGTASGRYYWTSAYYWESDHDNPASDPSNNRIHQVQQNTVCEGVTLERWRIESAMGTGTYLADIPGPVHGNVPGTGRLLLLASVRLQSGSGTRGGWYKPLRGLLGASDIVGGVVGHEIVGLLAENVLPILAHVPLVNVHRQPVGQIRVLPNVIGWQLRHGTKRASRRVLFPR